MIQLLTSPRTKRAANVLGIVLLIALVAPFAVYAAPEVVGADESFVVLTASMTPAIAPGDVVIVAERDPTAIAEGDVITFVRGTSEVPVTHRVISVVDEAGTLAFETMGDANEGPDPGLVVAGSLVGVVTLTIPYIGYVIQFAGTRIGFVTLVLLPFGLLAVTEIWSIVGGRGDSEPQPARTVDPVDEPSDGEGPAAESDSAVAAEPTGTADAADEPGGVSVDAVGGAAAVLAAFAPYAVSVALELRTAAAISVAIGASTLLLGALAEWVPASGVLDRSGRGATAAPEAETAEQAAAADGGDAEAGLPAGEGGEEADESDTEASESGTKASESDADTDSDGTEGIIEEAEPDGSSRHVSATTPPHPEPAGEGD
ncbi:peptidase S26B, signal peptidase [Halorubrum californiense DSM 19288]|uniref:Peptidase S26B, signal peptidase n=1 Tax=Halorubrum californiense DSM 19288 TaxID=1227465 RepID=M0E3H0_9EURY|nr:MULTISPECIES: signal peptidase I [Halorubrum]ELZ41563.1 peptidase S26B, signal peptidase [Halorubrum californiense DSM 19288]TKX65624.1 signal peptidase I [Halorubrum sp. GN11GM_10-3_MGM]